MNIFGRLLIHWKKEIINSFLEVDGHRLSNAGIERKNEDIGELFFVSHGFSNFVRARNRIMFTLNENEPILNTMKPKTNKRKYKSRGKYKK